MTNYSPSTVLREPQPADFAASPDAAPIDAGVAGGFRWLHAGTLSISVKYTIAMTVKILSVAKQPKNIMSNYSGTALAPGAGQGDLSASGGDATSQDAAPWVSPWWHPGYLSIKTKYAIAMFISILWFSFSLWLALPWMHDLAKLTNWFVAIFAIGGIAVVPGFMNAFLIASLALDRRPRHKVLEVYPGISILVAAYNEEASIADTIESIKRQNYPGPFQVMVIDDGSTDNTAAIVSAIDYPWLTFLKQPKNAGKSAALNRGLAEAKHDLVISLDGDSYLYKNALQNIVERYANDPVNTRAVAGCMLVRNSRVNWVTMMQEWDYFHGIAAIKRVQSLFQGTLVAQGAFSIFDRKTLIELGGWEECVGEDIVLTWAFLRAGYRVGHAEDALCFTNAPEKLSQLLKQRQRWARGMMEAFRRHPKILFMPALPTTFIWWNVLFPWLDLAFTFCFIPGIILALFGIYWIAGPMTLMLLPLSLLLNGAMYFVSANMFKAHNLKVRFNPWGFLTYALAYSVILQPVCVMGYMSEILGLRKTWGTK